jgi:threonine synthase
LNSSNFTYITDLSCSTCGKSYSASQVNTYCLDCQASLLSNYDFEAVRAHVDRDEIYRRPKGMWRWHEVLPVQHPDNCIFLGEGDTAHLRLQNLGNKLGLHNLLLKDESSNPTGTFKARGL